MSGRSSHLCRTSANSIVTQLVKNGAHKTGGRESTRFVNKQLSDLWKIPIPEGHMISEPFRPEEFAAALRRLKPGKSPGLDSIFPQFILHPGSALTSWFCDFLTSCMRQLKITKIWRTALVVAITKPEKPVGLFTVQGTRQFRASNSVTAKFYELLKKSKRWLVLNKLAQCCMISWPHSMITDRAVKVNHKVTTAHISQWHRNCRSWSQIRSLLISYHEE